MHAISSYRGNTNRPTNTHKQTNLQTRPITIAYTAPLSLARSEITLHNFNYNVLQLTKKQYYNFNYLAKL